MQAASSGQGNRDGRRERTSSREGRKEDERKDMEQILFFKVILFVFGMENRQRLFLMWIQLFQAVAVKVVTMKIGTTSFNSQ